MGVMIKPSDLKYRYPRKKETREQPKFTGKPDSRPFDRYDLYEVLPMFTAVMDALQSTDGVVLEHLEDLLNNDIPSFISSREEIYDALFETMRHILRQ